MRGVRASGTRVRRLAVADGERHAGPRPAAAWDPARYLRFAGERARPFADLRRAGAPPRPRATVVDLGCGEGALTASLAQRWPDARVTGVDSSAEMLAAAAAHAVPGRVEFALGDVRDWQPDGPVDVLVSNAVLHWVPGHDRPARPLGRRARARRLAGRPGAGQLPRPHATRCWPSSAGRRAGRRGSPTPRPGPDAVLEPAGYHDVLTAAGLAADVWETTYLHVLSGPDPVLGWVRSTVLRPVLAAPRTTTTAAELTAAYAAALRAAYPPRPDGTTAAALPPGLRRRPPPVLMEVSPCSPVCTTSRSPARQAARTRCAPSTAACWA